MKLYQTSHINESTDDKRVMGMELVFVSALCPMTGRLTEPLRQPEEWDHVKRLTNQLFLAWDDKNPLEGTVYLGDWQMPIEEWRPIEAFDGREKRAYLVWCEGNRNSYTAYRENGVWFHWSAGYARMTEVPTHWRPLPSPPNDKDRAREALPASACSTRSGINETSTN